MSREYLTPLEAARHLRYDGDDEKAVRAFLQWVRTHRVPVCHRGRRLLFRVTDLDAAVAPKRTDALRYFGRARGGR